MVSASQSPMRFFLVDDGGSVFYADTVGHFASGPCAAVAFAVGFAAYSEMLPQSATVAFVLAKVAVNSAVMECDPVVFAQVGAYLFGTEFAADKDVDVLNQLRIELIGFSPVLFGQPALLLCFFGAVLLSLDAVPLDFAADGAFVAVKLFGDFGDGAVAGQVLDMVSFVLGQLCSSWQSFLQERPYATAYWPFSVMESCTSKCESADLLLDQITSIYCPM